MALRPALPHPVRRRSARSRAGATRIALAVVVLAPSIVAGCKLLKHDDEDAGAAPSATAAATATAPATPTETAAATAAPLATTGAAARPAAGHAVKLADGGVAVAPGLDAAALPAFDAAVFHQAISGFDAAALPKGLPSTLPTTLPSTLPQIPGFPPPQPSAGQK